MKRLKIVLMTILIMSLNSMAMTMKTNEDSKKVYTVLEGNSQNIKGKPGLAVDLSYKSEHVDVGELSDINITIFTELSSGILKVNVKALDGSLSEMEEQDLEFRLSESTKTFPVNVQASSADNGIHYINITLALEGEGSRVLAVPVNVGDITSKINNKAVETTSTGVNISISTADEVIK